MLKGFFNKKEFLFLSLITFLYILPLLIINVPFIDEIWRLSTDYSWDKDARYLGTFLNHFLSFSPAGENFFPYGLILGALSITLAGYILCYSLEIGKDFKYNFLPLFLLIWPFTLSNLMWNTDIFLMMAPSFLLAVIPSLFFRQKKVYFLISYLSLLAILFLYQSNLPLYAIPIIMLMLKSSLGNKGNSKEVWTIIGISFLAIFTSLLSHKLIMMSVDLSSIPYYAERTKTMFSENFSLSGLFKRILLSWGTIAWSIERLATNGIYRNLFLIIFFLDIFLLVKTLRSSLLKINKLLIALSLLSLPLLVSALPSISLTTTALNIRSLTTVTYSIFVMIYWIYLFYPKVANVIALFFLVLSFPLVSSFSNALKYQHEMDQALIADIVSGVDTDNKVILNHGLVPVSPIVERVYKNYPTLAEVALFSHSLHRYDFGFWTVLNIGVNLGIIKTENITYPTHNSKEYIAQNLWDMPILKKSSLYYLRGDDQYLIVDFEKNEGNIKQEKPILTEKEMLMNERFSLVEGYLNALPSFLSTPLKKWITEWLSPAK